ncbi:MAG: hypothetical protein AB8H80_10330 [Planctomycetota bacterium]
MNPAPQRRLAPNFVAMALPAATALLLSGMAPAQKSEAKTPTPAAQDPAAQESGTQSAAAPPAYPDRDILSPFRTPSDVYAPPDELFRQLRIMQKIADRRAEDAFYVEGRQHINDPSWQRAYKRVQEIGINAGQLAQMMRLHNNGMQRDTAFYASLFVDNVDYALELIAHIPGEPQRRTREKALPRAVEFLNEHLAKRFGDLTDEQQQAARAAIPEIGSPVAKARGIKRAPVETDALYALRLVPFFQMLDLDASSDQAQGLWFLKEVFTLRPDLANLWLEPALPRLRELMLSTVPEVHQEAIAIFQLIGPRDLEAPPSEPEALLAWSKRASKQMFPPVRNLNNAIVQLFPSEERNAIATAGRNALQTSAIGDPFRGQREDGTWYHGFRIGYLPEELKPLAIPKDATVTTINGVPVDSAQQLLQTVERVLSKSNASPRRLFVEYVHGEKSHAIEYRIM